VIVIVSGTSSMAAGLNSSAFSSLQRGSVTDLLTDAIPSFETEASLWLEGQTLQENVTVDRLHNPSSASISAIPR
jgi:hypothetical protein